MPRQSAWFAAFGRHHINVEVAGILAAKRDPFTVRREMRIRGLSLKTRQSSRAAARARHGPNIICVSESDLRLAHCRRPQQARLPVWGLGPHGKLRKGETADHENREQQQRAVASQKTTSKICGNATDLRRKSLLRHVAVPPDRTDDCALLLA